MKNKNLMCSFKCCINGIINATKIERNLKIELLTMLFVILMGIILSINLLEWIICIVFFCLVIGGELFNSSIEKIVDIVNPNICMQAKYIKDVSAAAVLVFSLGSFLTGLMIFIPKIIRIII